MKNTTDWRVDAESQVYHGAVGTAAIASGLLAGALWQYLSPEATFFFGAVAASLASIFLMRMKTPDLFY